VHCHAQAPGKSDPQPATYRRDQMQRPPADRCHSASLSRASLDLEAQSCTRRPTAVLSGPPHVLVATGADKIKNARISSATVLALLSVTRRAARSTLVLSLCTSSKLRHAFLTTPHYRAPHPCTLALLHHRPYLPILPNLVRYAHQACPRRAPPLAAYLRIAKYTYSGPPTLATTPECVSPPPPDRSAFI
jgi:hypothetical protein